MANFEANPILQKLREFAPEAIQTIQDFRGELTISIDARDLRRICEFLREAPGLSFRFLSDLTALDHFPNEPRFEMVYHLFSFENSSRLRLKTQVGGVDPKVDSLVPVFPAANAFEREVFDLFGIHFEGHPDLRRILMPDDWEGHPLRKDYPTEGFR